MPSKLIEIKISEEKIEKIYGNKFIYRTKKIGKQRFVY
jgi:hypothetical protein